MPARARRWTAVALLLGVATVPAAAIETDQYFSWGRPLEDVTDLLNARVNVEIDALLAELNRRKRPERGGCQEVRSRLNDRFTMLIFNRLELWAVNSPLVSRVPDTEGIGEFRDGYVYGRTSAVDTGMWMPPSPTVLVAGVRIGTDKLTHFIGTAWYYHRWYRAARNEGASHEEAMDRALRKGLRVETTILGKRVSGIISPGDLEANYQGLLFYIGLCEGDDPIVEVRDGRWQRRRPFDFRDHVTPEWDESYQPVAFTKSRWKKVRPVLLGYCPMLDDPEVRAMRDAYRARDTTTPTELLLREFIASGRVPDPADFDIERVCAEAQSPA